MKKLVFSAGMEIIHIADTTMLYENEGNEVLYVMCDGCTGICTSNLQRSKYKCKKCIIGTKQLAKHFSHNIKVEKLSSYDSIIDKSELDNLKFEYSDFTDVKKIKFHGVNVGYACVSTYIFKTRNLNPAIDENFRDFFNTLLKATCYLILLQEKIIDSFQPAEVTYFNGRFCENRTLLDLCLNRGIHTHACDGVPVTNKKILKNVFYDCLPQSMKNWEKVFEASWNNPLVPLHDKEQIGRWFFESKIHQRYTGDTNYVQGQTFGAMPEGWDDNKTNYVIFNSSEDEYCSLDEEWDNAGVFDNQIEGIRYICSTLMQERPNIKLYLRIHPNLKNNKYKYHTILHTLPSEYPNLTVIPGDSKISSYSIMLNADRVIVFGSTMGVEAAYANKVVINLAGIIYDSLKVCYYPQTVEAFRSMLLDDNLALLDNYNCLKYGYGVVKSDLPSYIYLSNDKKNKKERLADIFLNSSILTSLHIHYINFLSKINSDGKAIPVKEA